MHSRDLGDSPRTHSNSESAARHRLVRCWRSSCGVQGHAPPHVRDPYLPGHSQAAAAAAAGPASPIPLTLFLWRRLRRPCASTPRARSGQTPRSWRLSPSPWLRRWLQRGGLCSAPGRPRRHFRRGRSSRTPRPATCLARPATGQRSPSATARWAAAARRRNVLCMQRLGRRRGGVLQLVWRPEPAGGRAIVHVQGELVWRAISYTPWPVDASEGPQEGERIRIAVGKVRSRQPRCVARGASGCGGHGPPASPACALLTGQQGIIITSEERSGARASPRPTPFWRAVARLPCLLAGRSSSLRCCPSPATWCWSRCPVRWALSSSTTPRVSGPWSSTW